jgi:hypothetical protein
MAIGSFTSPLAWRQRAALKASGAVFRFLKSITK